MSRSRWWIVLGLGALVIAVAVWFALRIPDRDAAGAAPAQTADGPQTHPAEEFQIRPPAPGGTADEGVERAAIGEPDVGARAAAARTENFALDGAVWIEGRVELPLNAPPDDSLQIFATATGDGSRWERQFASMSPHALIEALAEDSKQAIARRPVSADGSFRVPMRARSTGAMLRLDGRFLYARPCPTVEFAHATTPVRFDAKLGAWVCGRVVLPAGVPAELDLSPLEHSVPQLSGWGGAGGGFRCDAMLDAERTFEFRGIPTDMTSWFSLDPIVLAPVRISTWKIAPGERFDATVQLELGATLRGRVVDAAGAGVGGVELHARRTGGNGFTNDGDRRGDSDESGAFLLRGVSPGKTTLSASAKGFRVAQKKLDPLQNGQVVGGLEVVLERGNSVAGVVRWPDGTPAVAASVRALGPRARRSRDWGRHVEIVETDTTGAFEISGLDDGPFTVAAEVAPRGEAAPDAAESRAKPPAPEAKWWSRAVDVPAQTSDLALVLAAPLSVRGHVVDDRGAAVAEFEVEAEHDGDPSGETVDRPLTTSVHDEAGAFELTGFRLGHWTISATSGPRRRGPVVAIELPLAGEVALTLPRAASIAGVVLDPAGGAVEGATVEVRGSEGSIARTESHSASDGRFEIADAQPGHVTVAARAEGFAPSEPLELDLTAGGSARDLTLSLSIGGRIEGEVYEEGGAASVDRLVMVQAVGQRDFGQQVKTDAAGRFAIEHLAPGKYQAMALPPAGALDSGDADPSDFISKLKIARIEVRTGETTHVVLGAPPKAPVHVTGVCTRGRRPFAGAQITVFADGGSVLESMKIVRSGADGSFALTLDAPGNYVFVVGDGLISTSSLEFHEVIPEASEARVDLALPDASLAGVVLDPDGAPAAGVRVSIEHEQSTATWLNVDGMRGFESGEHGEFRFERLRPGTYTLRADPGNARQGSAVLSGVRVDDEAAVEGVVLHLPRGATLRGEVHDREGKPIADASIFVRDAQGKVLRLATRCETDANGRFTYEGVPAGRLTASARKGAVCSLESAPVDVPADGAGEVALVLDAGTMLRITVEGADGQPARGHVSVVDDAGREWSGLFGRDALESLLNEGFSSAEQRVGPLPPGRYKIGARTADGASASKPVTLSGQGERKVTLKLGP